MANPYTLTVIRAAVTVYNNCWMDPAMPPRRHSMAAIDAWISARYSDEIEDSEHDSDVRSAGLSPTGYP